MFCSIRRSSRKKTLVLLIDKAQELTAEGRICNADYLPGNDVRRAGSLVGLHAAVRCKHWEDLSATCIERMIVAELGPSYRLVPCNPTLPTKQGRHEAAAIDYILVD